MPRDHERRAPAAARFIASFSSLRGSVAHVLYASGCFRLVMGDDVIWLAARDVHGALVIAGRLLRRHWGFEPLPERQARAARRGLPGVPSGDGAT